MLETAIIRIYYENDCCEPLYGELFSKDAEIIINIPQQSKEWHEQRKYRVTALLDWRVFIGSRIYELFTYSKNEWENKSKKYFYGGSFHNKYTKHGVKFESDAKEAFIAQTSFHVVDCGMVVSNSNPWLGYSPDGVIFESGRPVALLEVKCLYEGATKTITEVLEKCRFIGKRGNAYSLREKHKYYAQVQLGIIGFTIRHRF
ncbi:uncharacterized protein LOC123320978 [Coccinella septempunctata]|uniref:uncharacterized protein LOC123320978 n=1 Tax=Coccinella septempunctata TaxID=41139 RepID=UPI001D07F50C|nr:uncharacterized protein LOC123320978 [Coccinella septempunctata]